MILLRIILYRNILCQYFLNFILFSEIVQKLSFCDLVHKLTLPGMGRAILSLCCNLRDFPDKVINNLDFLHLLAVHLLDLADQDFTDKPVQYGLVQFLNGGIAPDFLDKGTDFAFLRIRPALHHRQIVQALLVGKKISLIWTRPQNPCGAADNISNQVLDMTAIAV